MSSDFHNLPGGELVQKGLADLNEGVSSIESLVVCVGSPRLEGLGIKVAVPPELGSPEGALYARLSSKSPATAHSDYNALIRRLVSFERAYELQQLT